MRHPVLINLGVQPLEFDVGVVDAELLRRARRPAGGSAIKGSRRAVFGATAPEGAAWADDLLHSFKHAGYDPTWQRLVEWQATLRGPAKRQAADRLLNYVSQRADLILYPEFAAHGWQIGSGPTESRCKTTTHRLKGRGRRWNRRNAEAVAALTTLTDSQPWTAY